MRWWGIAVVALVVGCDGVFNLDHLPAPTDATSDAKTVADCRLDYIPIANAPKTSRYRFAGVGLPWPQAEADCEDDLPANTSHLVVFDTFDERVAVEEYLFGLVGDFSAHAGYGRNLADDPMTGFFAVTGAAVPDTRPPWGGNEPNNGDGTGAPEPVVWFGYQSGLIDEPTDVAFGYMCECDHQPVTKHFTF